MTSLADGGSGKKSTSAGRKKTSENKADRTVRKVLSKRHIDFRSALETPYPAARDMLVVRQSSGKKSALSRKNSDIPPYADPDTPLGIVKPVISTVNVKLQLD